MLGFNDNVVLACAAHSVYGTSSFKAPPKPDSKIVELLGVEAHEMVLAFATLPRTKRWWLKTRLPGYSITMWENLAAIEVVNLAEQM